VHARKDRVAVQVPESGAPGAAGRRSSRRCSLQHEENASIRSRSWLLATTRSRTVHQSRRDLISTREPVSGYGDSVAGRSTITPGPLPPARPSRAGAGWVIASVIWPRSDRMVAEATLCKIALSRPAPTARPGGR